MSFEVFEGSIEDVPLTAALFVTTMEQDAHWARLMKDVKVDEWLAWQEDIFKLRWTLPDKRVFFAREVATKKVVGYTTLGSPGSYTQEQIDAANGAPPLPEGINLPLMKEMFSVIGMSNKHGYDPTVHYRKLFPLSALQHPQCVLKKQGPAKLIISVDRKGIVVLPEYQRRGVASLLSQHLNDIVDKEGGTTYAITTHIAMLIFKKQGFMVLGAKNVGTLKVGDAQVQDYVMRREPNAKRAVE
ncbi:hypothetical protein VTL71DRAFT_943 [Oculimacula yallundae]|uniref:N-acetyltransferase domain-containing protein n=1 Tax=Oculimacula yallundae TaxID=86028 RepID=A0ABR4D1F2_9HELO